MVVRLELMDIWIDWCKVLITFWALFGKKAPFTLFAIKIIKNNSVRLSLPHLWDNPGSSCSCVSIVNMPVWDSVCLEGANLKCHCEPRFSGSFQIHSKHPLVAALMCFPAEPSASMPAPSMGRSRWKGGEGACLGLAGRGVWIRQQQSLEGRRGEEQSPRLQGWEPGIRGTSPLVIAKVRVQVRSIPCSAHTKDDSVTPQWSLIREQA